MRVLVTGDKGFVGVETVKLLKEQGHEVIGYDLMDGYDIRDREQFGWACNPRNQKVDRILHLAAIARFADADKDPQLAFETNVDGTRNVASVANEHHIPVVFSSTGSAIMPLDSYDAPFDEKIPARGNSVYGCSKAIAESYIQEVTPHIILRYSHLYGKDKRMHGLIGGYLDRINRGLKPVLHGGLQTNDFCYIEDIARANVLALTAPWDCWNNIFNIGRGDELSAEEAGKIVCEAFGYEGTIDKTEGRTVDPSRFVFSVKKAEAMLKFKAKYSFREGLAHMLKLINEENKTRPQGK